MINIKNRLKKLEKNTISDRYKINFNNDTYKLVNSLELLKFSIKTAREKYYNKNTTINVEPLQNEENNNFLNICLAIMNL